MSTELEARERTTAANVAANGAAPDPSAALSPAPEARVSSPELAPDAAPTAGDGRPRAEDDRTVSGPERESAPVHVDQVAGPVAQAPQEWTVQVPVIPPKQWTTGAAQAAAPARPDKVSWWERRRRNTVRWGDPEHQDRMPKYNHKALDFGFYMSVLMAGVGQVLYYKDLFGGGEKGWVLGIVMGAFLEVSMVGACERACLRRCQGAKGWQLLFAVSVLICLFAATMNFLHWLTANNISAALGFGIASLVGYMVHAGDRLIESKGWLVRQAAREAAAVDADRYAKQEGRKVRAAAQRAREGVAPAAPRPASQDAASRKVTRPQPAAKAAPEASAAPSERPVKAAQEKQITGEVPGVSDAEIFAYLDQHPKATPAELEQHFNKQYPAAARSRKYYQRARSRWTDRAPELSVVAS